ncbi:MAG: DUF58 domain-containing protein [Treponema sp.]|jgi:uncharacterized protein (DUF58 family)|nr:DUF58 domain-containing protein [Treponema sp.]
MTWGAIQIRRNRLLLAGIVILLPFYLFVPLALCQFFCLFLLFLLTGSRLYSEYLIRNIKIVRRDSELRVFRYEWVKVELRIENRGILPAFMVATSDSTGGLPVVKNQKIFCSLSRKSWTMLVWQGHCTERGEFSLGPVIVRGADPLGLFPFQLTAHETTRLFVYPIYRSISLKTPSGIPLGKMLSSNPLFEDITYRRSLRPYQSGDELRRINWKATARMSEANSLMVNEYEATASHPLMIFLNANRDEYPLKKHAVFIERTIEAAATLCLKAARERQDLGIIIYTGHESIRVITPAAFTLVPILERLAILDWTKPANTVSDDEGIPGSAGAMLDQGKRLSYGTRFFYAGPDLGDEAYISLNSLKRHRLSLEYLIIDDRAMPFLVPGNSPRYQMRESGREII